MIETLLREQWIFIALIFFGIIFYIAWLRRKDRIWIEKRFGREKVLAMSFGVNYFGRASEEGKPRRSSGFLILLKDRLFFRSRLTNQEVEIPGDKIQRIYPDSEHKGVSLHQSVMKIDYYNEQNEKDSVAFRVPYPPQWIQAIENIRSSGEED